MKMPDFLAKRDPDSHKGDYGHALLIAGSYGKMGAAVLAAKACLRSGVGLLTVHVPRCGVEILQTAVPEAMLSIDNDEFRFTSLPENIDRYDAVAVGPGIGTEDSTQTALLAFLGARCKSGQKGFLVLDADALNILALHPESLHLAAGAVITPHAKEYQRLFGDSQPQAMADMHDLVIVKKAHHTMIYAPHSSAMENNTGNPGMATAGSGDVLTGVTLGITAQHSAYISRHGEDGLSLQDAAALAVYMHGSAGDKAAQRRSLYSIIASDIIDSI